MAEFNREAFINEFVEHMLDENLEEDTKMEAGELPDAYSDRDQLEVMKEILQKMDELEDLEEFQEARLNHFRNMFFQSALMVAAKELEEENSSTEDEGTEVSAKEPADSAADEVPFDLDGPESGGYALPKEEKEEKSE